MVEARTRQQVVREIEAPGIDRLLDERDPNARLLEIRGSREAARQAGAENDDVELSHCPPDSRVDPVSVRVTDVSRRPRYTSRTRSSSARRAAGPSSATRPRCMTSAR